jgi:hypothetical protein
MPYTGQRTPVSDRIETRPWHRDWRAIRFVFLGYLPWLAVLNLVWEIAQLPLYTIWRDTTPAYIAFAVAHCTLGDLLIGLAAFGLALITTRASGFASWRWPWIIATTVAIGVAYSLFSEWLNTRIVENWGYSALMPSLHIDGVSIGLSPLLQWLLLPPLAIYLAKRKRLPGT